MNTNIKNFLLCPVPEDQKPITEYIGLKENFLTSWTTLSQKNYKLKIIKLFINNLIIFSLLTVSTLITNQNNFFNWLFINSFNSLNLIIFLFIIIIFRWQQNQTRFNQTRLFYEEGSWYDSQVWEKPFLIIKNDKLISTQKIEPILQRLKQTLLFLVYLDIICLILFQL